MDRTKELQQRREIAARKALADLEGGSVYPISKARDGHGLDQGFFRGVRGSEEGVEIMPLHLDREMLVTKSLRESLDPEEAMRAYGGEDYNFPSKAHEKAYSEYIHRLPALRQSFKDRVYTGLGAFPEQVDPQKQVEISRLIDRGSHGDLRPEMVDLAKEQYEFDRETQKADYDLREKTEMNRLDRTFEEMYQQQLANKQDK